MAIKAGSIIMVGNDSVLIDRLQSAGPGQVNVPVETIYELGNYKSVAQIRDIPDLSFTMESYDVSTEIEAFLLDLSAPPAATVLDFAAAKAVEVKSAFKAGANAASPFDTVNSVGIPYLALEQMQYRFGLRDDARQTATLRGDSIYYNPGSTYVETTVGTGVAAQAVLTAHPAYGTDEGGVPRRVLCVSAGQRRLVYGVDYTETEGTVTAGAAVTTVTLVAAVPVTDKIKLMYSSPDVEAFPQNVHALASVKPAAIRGRDIAVYLGGYDGANPYTNRLAGVQTATVDWRVTLQKDEEFGNYHYVDQDFDVPVVSGTVGVKPQDPAVMLKLMQQLSGVGALRSANATAAPVIPLDIVLHNPLDGSVLKRLHVVDARFTVPGFDARVQQKLDLTINYTSDQGNLEVTGV